MADITAETIEKVLAIAPPVLFHDVEDAHGVTTVFSSKPLHQVQAAKPDLPPDVDVVTLTGLADLIKQNLEDADFVKDFLIHIENETTVTLKERVSDKYGRRLVLAQAKPVEFQKFKFGQWLDQEEFVIAVASLFADTPDKQEVLGRAATITNQASITGEDDGTTQRVTVKKGLQLAAQVVLKPRVSLAPFRTFPELDQPVSEFVFRARCDGESSVKLMLVEADGGRWKVDAISKILTAVEAFDLGVPIIA